VLLSSCATQRKITYLQDIQPEVPINIQNNGDLVLEPGDRVTITVFSRDRELSELFNLVERVPGEGTSRRHQYTVKPDGTVEIPTLGSVYVQGLTRLEVEDKIKYELLASKLLLDPTVIVEYYDLAFSTIGALGVGRHEIPKDRINILEALALAGDLSLMGQRENVLVLRTENGIQTPYLVDLTSVESVYSSPVYYIRQNDIIYVEPNKKLAAQSDPNASTFQNFGFWISLPNTITSLVLLLSRWFVK
jgi:polysaccharide export outer membrane protein